MNTLGLLIKSCSDPQRWYANLIGVTVPYLGDVGWGEYKSKEPSGLTNFVQHKDATIINISEGQNEKI